MSTIDPKSFYNDRMPEKLGGDYEHARWHANSFQEAQYGMMRSLLRRYVLPLAAQARTVLEVGPGAATWTKFLVKKNPNARFTLLDISKEMLARAKAALPHVAAEYVESDLVEFSSAESFDLVFSSRAIEYMPDKAAAVKKIASLTAEGGYAIIFTKMPKPFSEKLSRRTFSDFHAGRIPPSELIALFQQHGCRLVCVRLATASVPGLHSPFLNRAFFAVFSRFPLLSPLSVFAESYMLIVKKNGN